MSFLKKSRNYRTPCPLSSISLNWTGLFSSSLVYLTTDYCFGLFERHNAVFRRPDRAPRARCTGRLPATGDGTAITDRSGGDAGGDYSRRDEHI